MFTLLLLYRRAHPYTVYRPRGWALKVSTGFTTLVVSLSVSVECIKQKTGRHGVQLYAAATVFVWANGFWASI